MPLDSKAVEPQSHAYDAREVELRWQARWHGARIFEAVRRADQPKWFIVELPPFANGDLHLGHARNYIAADAGARFRRMCGYDVLYTTGFDTFGLPNELAAREQGCHPEALARRCSDAMLAQLVRLGLSHDRTRISAYHDADYYRWVQWVFLKLLEAGYCVRRRAAANWCDACATTLADSLVEAGRCWRCGGKVETRLQEQWFVREAEFADAMLEGLPALDGWPEHVKRIHVDWIGRKEGLSVRFRCTGADERVLPVFFEEPSALGGTAFVAIGAHHPFVASLVEAGACPESSAASAPFVVPNIALAVPLCERSVPLVVVPASVPGDEWALPGLPSTVEADRIVAGQLGIASPRPNASDSAGGGHDLAARLVEDGFAAPAVRYRLRDWNIARSRYWGPPVPVVHCAHCGVVPVPEDALPVILPLDVDLSLPGNPLARHAAFSSTHCPRCGAAAERDTDTFEAYSSPWWYHWLCKSPGEPYPFSRDDERDWLPVDVMIGGADQIRTCFFHVRMIAKALTRLEVTACDEPVTTLVAIGFVKRDNRKMSKSGGNAVTLEHLIARYGVDALRLGMLSAGALDSDFNWSDDVVSRQRKFLSSLWKFGTAVFAASPAADTPPGDTPLRIRLRGWVDTAARKVTANMLRHDYHLAVRNIAFLYDRLIAFDKDARKGGPMAAADAAALAHALGRLILLLSPLAPHFAEELWSLAPPYVREALGQRDPGFACCTAWPAALVDDAAPRTRSAARKDRSCAAATEKLT
jgi:leucyl-tRNA synthetase